MNNALQQLTVHVHHSFIPHICLKITTSRGVLNFQGCHESCRSLVVPSRLVDFDIYASVPSEVDNADDELKLK